MNDRYRMEQKGHTRKSASSAKPKREAGSASASVKKAAKSARPKLFAKSPARQPTAPVPSTPEMKKLRRYWWITMGIAIVVAVAMVPISKYKNSTLDSVLFAVYAAALGGALYLEFGPLRRMRKEAVEAAKAKGSKGARAVAKPSPKAPAKKDTQPAAPVAVTPEPQTLSAKALQFFVGKPKPPKAREDGADVPAAGEGDDKE